MSDPLVLLVQFAATWTMVGIIWFVQVVHYPLFSRVDGPGSGAYAVENQRRTSWVVGPPMAAEGITALWLAASPPGGVGRVLPVVGLVLLALVLGLALRLAERALRDDAMHTCFHYDGPLFNSAQRSTARTILLMSTGSWSPLRLRTHILAGAVCGAREPSPCTIVGGIEPSLRCT